MAWFDWLRRNQKTEGQQDSQKASDGSIVIDVAGGGIKQTAAGVIGAVGKISAISLDGKNSA